MLSVIIATLDSERALVHSLAPLVSGATSGLITEVLVADAGSSDDTAAVADVAGCNFLIVEGSLGKRLRTATATARAPWLLFLQPGTILDTLWVGDAQGFIQGFVQGFGEQPAGGFEAAAFRRDTQAQSGFGEAISQLVAVLGARPRPEQGLIISQACYVRIGGHAERAADPGGRPYSADRPTAHRDALGASLSGQSTRYLTKSSIWPTLAP
jgi:hypothetical protein